MSRTIFQVVAISDASSISLGLVFRIVKLNSLLSFRYAVAFDRRMSVSGLELNSVAGGWMLSLGGQL